MNDHAIEVKQLSKTFKIHPSPLHMLSNIFTKKNDCKKFTALNNITFKVKKGDVVGIVGRNGAGKSTLLRILAGTLDNTSGSYKVIGKVSAILELGTGFHDDYTGRENIFMGGMCLGMSRKEINGKVDEIIRFSELESVIDQPFKTYSSGMKARLTFSVAISVDPDIFFIDEALAIGDAVFVAKCIKRINEICRSGATVFFVTHSTDLVRRLCNRCIYLKDGEIHLDGDAQNISTIYDIDMLEIASDTIKSFKLGAKGGNGPANITEIKILNKDEKPSNGFFQHDQMILRVSFFSDKKINNPAIWLKFTRTDGVIGATFFSHEPDMIDIGSFHKGAHEIDLIITDLMLGDGHFDITIAIFEERLNKADTAYYPDPMSIWERTDRIAVQRKSRPLASIFDQPVMIRRRSDLESTEK